MNILTNTIICIFLYSCAAADLNSDIKSQDSNDYQSSEEFADIPTAVAGAFLVCMKDESLAPDNVGCAMMTSEKEKSEDSDAIADEQRVVAANKTTKENVFLEKIEGSKNWSWSGWIDGEINDFEFSFENVDGSNDDIVATEQLMTSGEITIRIKNEAPYISRSYLHYIFEGKKNQIELGRKGLNKSATVYIPKGSTKIKLNAEVYTGLLWDRWQDIFRLELDHKKDVHCFRFKGSSLKTKYDEKCSK